MSYAVIKGTSYILAHVPDMVMYNGSAQTMEKDAHPNSEYLKKLPQHIRNYEEIVSYPPNQVYIGGITPEDLRDYPMPWYEEKVEGAERYGKFGEIMPQEEFIGLMKIVDVFDLVKLENNFTKEIRKKLSQHPLMTEDLVLKLKEGVDLEEVNKNIRDYHAKGIYHNNRIVGCVKRAHELDPNLNAGIMFENIVAKASGVLSFLHLLDKNNIDASSIDYVIECSEEACGDMNQRGGGNFAKAIAEVAGAINATGSDTRAFCAAPTHALIEAAALVKAEVYENVVVLAGGAIAKLGMNGKDHVKKEMPVLEDVLGGFAILVSKDDGINPIIRTDLLGRHTVGTSSSPQAVITSLIATPLDKGGLKITDIDKYSVEMQNPDITKPAGAGDVPEANYKMIAALGIKRGEIQKQDVATFGEKYGMPGWVTTQGHIPSGVPYVGHGREAFLKKEIKRAMIIGKGSLFLARMTNQFDGVSIIIEENIGQSNKMEKGISEIDIKNMIAEAMRNFATHLLGE